MSARVAVVGTRSPSHELMKLVEDYVYSLDREDIVVSGACRGVDAFAAKIAIRRGMRVKEFPAIETEQVSYTDACRARNVEIAKYCDRMIAFPGPTSKGTWDVARKARSRNKPVLVVTPETTYQYEVLP